eukprot:CAMPEP_0178455524 /NCGR_PEP_ID=MMETSP0689_2-20121128/45958_1 /TAXON_ID=160604 /ORGANISM="Amphidinium massartii, Strain CS-259" /LENGTH=52 /DNA_ID=CAMNT_0020081571 /DNA_START=29 /DNA_END=184 /DNA_ORIENTATION=+
MHWQACLGVAMLASPHFLNACAQAVAVDSKGRKFVIDANSGGSVCAQHNGFK